MIRSRRVGICHSDYELLAGQYIIPISYPVIPGHEWVGEVVEVGKNVNRPQARRPRRRRVRDQDAGAHPPLRLLDGRRQPRVFRRPPRMAAQAAGRGRRREGRADRAVHLRLLRGPAQWRAQRFRDGRGLGRRHHRPRHGGGRHRHGRARDRRRPGAAASRHRQTAWAPTRPSIRRPAIRPRRCRS